MSRKTWVVLGVFGVIAVAIPARAVHFIVRANMEAPPGTTLEVPVDLYGEGVVVSTARNDLFVAPPLTIRAKDGTPDCEARSPEYPTTFGFLPLSCVAGACTGVRASIDVAPPVDVRGIVYDCIVEIPPDAPPGFYPLLISNAAATDADGNALPTTTQNDVISVPELPKSGMLFVGTVEGLPGESVWFDVTLEATVAAQVIGAMADVEYDPLTPVVGDGLGKARCIVNPSVNQPGDFDFSPPSCLKYMSCNSVGVDIGDWEDPKAFFPSGAAMFSCLVSISPSAPPGVYPLSCQYVRIIAYDTGFINSHCNSGAIHVLAAETPTGTPTATPPAPSPAPSGTATPVAPTSTRTVSPASTSTIAPTLTPRASDSGSCAVVAPSASDAPLLLLLPVAALLLLQARRRARADMR